MMWRKKNQWQFPVISFVTHDCSMITPTQICRFWFRKLSCNDLGIGLLKTWSITQSWERAHNTFYFYMIDDGKLHSVWSYALLVYNTFIRRCLSNKSWYQCIHTCRTDYGTIRIFRSAVFCALLKSGYLE